jgi:two-component system sensor histidine kinase RegB
MAEPETTKQGQQRGTFPKEEEKRNVGRENPNVNPEQGKREGMGLGFFIAKVLLERTGGTVRAVNLPDHGARVSVNWPRGVIDGETPPGTADDMD